MKKLLLTVCNGNIHRSVIAAACIDRKIRDKGLTNRYEVLSRGLQGTQGTEPSRHKNLRDYPMEWPLTEPFLRELDIEIADDQATTPITRTIAERASIILAMDRPVLSQKQNSLLNQFPDLSTKMLLFSELAGKIEDVPDVGGVADVTIHRASVEMIHSIIEKHFEDLLHLASNK